MARSRQQKAGSRSGARRSGGWLASLVGAVLLSACQSTPHCPSSPEPTASEIAAEVYRRAETERAARLAREVEQLRADLSQAEAALVAAESGLRGSYSRADAVSSLAQARIRVARAGREAPWLGDEVGEAESKLADADLQVAAGHFGAALFFVYRAERIADALEAEAKRVYSTPGARFIRGRRVNLRSGPATTERILTVLPMGTPVFAENTEAAWVLVRTEAGDVGWVHSSLVGGRP